MGSSVTSLTLQTPTRNTGRQVEWLGGAQVQVIVRVACEGEPGVEGVKGEVREG